jgi:hypothetical protein
MLKLPPPRFPRMDRGVRPLNDTGAMYETTTFIDPTPRVPGFHDAWCRVTWTPAQGEPVTVAGPYLDADFPGGAIRLGCGIEQAEHDLGLPYLDPDKAVAVADAVTAQLCLGPTAELSCPLGRFVVELVPRPV